MIFQPNLHLKSIRSKYLLPKSISPLLISHLHHRFSLLREVPPQLLIEEEFFNLSHGVCHEDLTVEPTISSGFLAGLWVFAKESLIQLNDVVPCVDYLKDTKVEIHFSLNLIEDEYAPCSKYEKDAEMYSIHGVLIQKSSQHLFAKGSPLISKRFAVCSSSVCGLWVTVTCEYYISVFGGANGTAIRCSHECDRMGLADVRNPDLEKASVMQGGTRVEWLMLHHCIHVRALVVADALWVFDKMLQWVITAGWFWCSLKREGMVNKITNGYRAHGEFYPVALLENLIGFETISGSVPCADIHLSLFCLRCYDVLSEYYEWCYVIAWDFNRTGALGWCLGFHRGSLKLKFFWVLDLLLLIQKRTIFVLATMAHRGGVVMGTFGIRWCVTSCAHWSIDVSTDEWESDYAGCSKIMIVINGILQLGDARDRIIEPVISLSANTWWYFVDISIEGNSSIAVTQLRGNLIINMMNWIIGSVQVFEVMLDHTMFGMQLDWDEFRACVFAMKRQNRYFLVFVAVISCEQGCGKEWEIDVQNLKGSVACQFEIECGLCKAATSIVVRHVALTIGQKMRQYKDGVYLVFRLWKMQVFYSKTKELHDDVCLKMISLIGMLDIDQSPYNAGTHFSHGGEHTTTVAICLHHVDEMLGEPGTDCMTCRAIVLHDATEMDVSRGCNARLMEQCCCWTIYSVIGLQDNRAIHGQWVSSKWVMHYVAILVIPFGMIVVVSWCFMPAVAELTGKMVFLIRLMCISQIWDVGVGECNGMQVAFAPSSHDSKNYDPKPFDLNGDSKEVVLHMGFVNQLGAGSSNKKLAGGAFLKANSQVDGCNMDGLADLRLCHCMVYLLLFMGFVRHVPSLKFRLSNVAYQVTMLGCGPGGPFTTSFLA